MTLSVCGRHHGLRLNAANACAAVAVEGHTQSWPLELLSSRPYLGLLKLRCHLSAAIQCVRGDTAFHPVTWYGLGRLRHLFEDAVRRRLAWTYGRLNDVYEEEETTRHFR